MRHVRYAISEDGIKANYNEAPEVTAKDEVESAFNISIHPETRLRRVETENDVKFFLTTKTDGDLSRDEFEVEIPDEEIENIKTIGDLTEYIQNNM